MMMSPEMYAEEHRDDSFEELIETRNVLVDELRTLEKIVFDKEQKGNAWDICPEPDVQYQMTLEYLARLCVLLSNKFNDEVVNTDD